MCTLVAVMVDDITPLSLLLNAEKSLNTLMSVSLDHWLVMLLGGVMAASVVFKCRGMWAQEGIWTGQRMVKLEVQWRKRKVVSN